MIHKLEKYLEKIQNYDHDKKKMIMWIGIPATLGVIIFCWLSVSDFGIPKTTANEMPKDNKTSNSEIFMSGLKETMDEIKNAAKDLREKINGANSFNVSGQEAPTTANALETITSTTTADLENSTTTIPEITSATTTQ